MAKRIADKELTDRNWDQEDEGEEAGTFLLASQDVLKGRAMKKAKRRNTGAESEGGGAFRSFKGFSLSASVGGGASPGGGGASLPFSGFGNGGGFKGLGGLTNGTSGTSTFGGFSVPPTSTAAPGLTFNSPAPTDTKQTNGSAPLPPKTSSFSGAVGGAGGSSKEYRRQLTALNVSVRDWITKHVNDNPLCDLNPIFRDYERHLASIEKQYGATQTDSGAEEKQQDAATSSAPAPPAAATAPSSSSSSSSSLFSFGKTEEKSTSLPTGVSFNFGQKVDSSVLGSLGSTPSFSFSSTSSSSSSGPSLFGGATAPLSFSGTKTDDAQPAADENAEESEEPPKPEVKEVKEDNAFYSKKCKMFYKKEAEFKEKGVGTLHLKETAEGKTQMIIRADTNLGNILLNILVPSSMPCSRVGKNNVMVVCVPNPPLDDKSPSSPVPLLIRVKTAEDADELHKILEEKKS